MRWEYRLKQFLAHIQADEASVDDGLVRDLLSNEAYELFKEMPPGDQVHALCVLRALCEAGEKSLEMAWAALLHDVSKSRGGLKTWHRALSVALEALDDDWLSRLASSDSDSWRYPFYVHLCHAELGALMCESAGCARIVVAMVRYHETPLEDVEDLALRRKLAALKMADDAC